MCYHNKLLTYLAIVFTAKTLLLFIYFSVLPVKVDAKSKVIRHFFLKMHVTREKCPQKPEYQTLFVVGVPEFCDQVNDLC